MSERKKFEFKCISSRNTEMGIPYFYYAIYRKYHHECNFIITEREIGESVKVDYLFFDYNSLIHPCARKVIEEVASFELDVNVLEDKIINECIVYTNYVMNLIGAKGVYIMIDGVAPMAKIHQQRERRYKSWFFKADKSVWDTNKITPGTAFMEKLARTLRERLRNCVISAADEPGEGEHKMMKVISELNGATKVCIYGLDADLIMLSLLSEHRDNIILLRDQQGGQGETQYAFVDMGKLSKALANELLIGGQSDCGQTLSSMIWDFVMLCFLLGNDFLEHIPSLLIRENGVNVLMKAYKKVRQQQRHGLVEINDSASRINLDMLTDIFGELAATEDYFFRRVKKDVVWKETQDLGEIENVVFLKQDLVEFKTNDFKRRFYLYYNIRDEKVACRDYIEGLFWVLGYYNNHKHNNWSWSYKHGNTPFASDIYDYLVSKRGELEEYLNVSKNLVSSEPITPLKQLTLVLPKDSLMGILGDNDNTQRLKRLLSTESQSVMCLFPNTIIVDLFDREYLWQSKVFFGEILSTPNFFLSC